MGARSLDRSKSTRRLLMKVVMLAMYLAPALLRDQEIPSRTLMVHTIILLNLMLMILYFKMVLQHL